MRISSFVIGVVTVVAAGVAGVTAFSAAAGSTPAKVPVTTTVPAASQHDSGHVTIKFRRCSDQALLDHGVCVTHLTKTVMVKPAPAPASAQVRHEAGQPADDGPAVRNHSDDGSGDDSGDDFGVTPTPAPTPTPGDDGGDDDGGDTEPGDD